MRNILYLWYKSQTNIVFISYHHGLQSQCTMQLYFDPDYLQNNFLFKMH